MKFNNNGERVNKKVTKKYALAKKNQASAGFNIPFSVFCFGDEDGGFGGFFA